MKPKVAGCCTKCDAEVFDVVTRDPETRLPTKIGAAHDDAVRVTFILVSGSKMDLTFCQHCADGLEPADFAHIWRRVMLSWVNESSKDHPHVKSQTANGIVGLSHKQRWKGVA
jgi:hypothetical protein